MGQKGKGFMNLETTWEYALNNFSLQDPQKVALNSAVEFNEEQKTFNIFFLQENYTIKHPSGDIWDSTGEKASLYISIILLHYLNTSNGNPLSGKWISFKELPGGQIYIDPFRKRALYPFLKAFGSSPSTFIEAASKIGGFHNPQLGEYSMVVPVLPRVPVAFILHPGDEEFSPTANILYDAHASSYLPTEDYAHLPGLVIKELKVNS